MSIDYVSYVDKQFHPVPIMATPKKPKTPRTLRLEIVEKYQPVYWQQFWDHNQITPTHLWTGRSEDVEGLSVESRKVLCGKTIANDGSMRTMTPGEARWFCRACVRIALRRERKESGQ